MSKTIREWLEQLPEPSYVDEFDRPAEQPTAFPDELSVARTNITKLVAENARLERENARLETIIDEFRIPPMDETNHVKYGCHCELAPGEPPDGCVIDDNMPELCVHAGRFLRKEECPEWRPIKQQGQ